MSTPYRILSLDGGGSWALIQVRCLQALFGPEARGHCILRQFDLVAANSGGSIVLAGLVADLPLSVILTVFETEANRRAIFSPTGSRFWRAVHRLGHTFSLSFLQVGPHYATERKLTALQAVLQGLEKPRPDGKGIATVCLEDVPAYVGGTAAHGPHFLIPTFDYNRQRSSFFRSDKASLGNTAVLQQALGGLAGHPHKGITLLEAVHACSTAPVNFFDRPACVKIHGQENHLWDGGVAGYNNPVLAAVTEALSNNIDADRIRVLTIGTGTQLWPVASAGQVPDFAALVTEPVAEAGFSDDIRKLASSIVNAPPDAASFVAFTVLNPGFVSRGATNQNFIRANPSFQPTLKGTRWVAPGKFLQDDVKAIQKIELDAITEEEIGLIKSICTAWLDNELPNQPIRAGATLQCLLGQATFGDVQAAFEAMFPIAVPC